MSLKVIIDSVDPDGVQARSIAFDGGNMLKSMLRHLGAEPPARILTIGGSTRNQLLMRLKASVFGTPLTVLDLPDTTCLGAALLGGIAAGMFADIDEARRHLRVPVRMVEPDAAWSQGYRERRQMTYAAAYAALRPLHARLLDE